MIDEILKKIEWNGAEWTPIESSIDQALTAIYEIGLEKIGKDEQKPEPPFNYLGEGIPLEPLAVELRNELRAAQRKAWAKACGVAEK